MIVGGLNPEADVGLMASSSQVRHQTRVPWAGGDVSKTVAMLVINHAVPRVGWVSFITSDFKLVRLMISVGSKSAASSSSRVRRLSNYFVISATTDDFVRSKRQAH